MDLHGRRKGIMGWGVAGSRVLQPTWLGVELLGPKATSKASTI